jgi:hypothetical protein
MIDELRLRESLQRLLRDTETAIRERISDEPSIEAQLRERHAAAVRAGRTAGSPAGYNAFADEAITQSAAHWLLGCVFVRFLEDNGGLDTLHSKVAWIAGPGERLGLAKANRTLFLRPDPLLTDRDYLLHVFAEVSKLPGIAGLFDRRHNPLFQLAPTAQGAAKIVDFFQTVDPDTGSLVHDFTDPDRRTRFLGDLYQNLSKSARECYALYQTPDFIIDFILDRTLTPALDVFGLDQVRLIDPACGSGHFLLATFERLFRLWRNCEPGTNPPVLAQKALDAICGVDLNPFAIEISRFRLLIAALEASGITRLRDALDFRVQVAVGDSLLHGSRPRDIGGVQTRLYEDRLQFFYEAEDAEEVRRILSQTYHVVVGNPPYINVSDPVLRDAYRGRFSTCHGKYQLGIPFTERFFDLTVRSDDPKKEQAGWMGMIVSNAFMKRTFGKKLIEKFLRHRDLTHVIDTSGPRLDAHGTPTVILIGRNQIPIAPVIRAVRGKQGEIVRPPDPSSSPIWVEIRDRTNEPGYDGPYISVDDVPRESFAHHPWSIGGGGAAELREALEDACVSRLSEVADEVGVQTITGEEDVFVRPRSAFLRAGITETCPFITGDDIRDWHTRSGSSVLNPYVDRAEARLSTRTERSLWPWREQLRQRKYFGQTQAERGYQWWEYSIAMVSRQSPPWLAIADLATHNSVIFETRLRVFDQHSPVMKLPEGCSEKEHLELLGLLNSSSACFWFKQVCHNRGTGGIGGGLATEGWERFYEIDNTRLKQFPVPAERPLALAKLIQAEAEARIALLPDIICGKGVPTRAGLDAARDRAAAHLARMMALQEELDWHCYRLYGIIDEDLTVPPDQVPPLRLGERAFEILMARQGRATTWFDRHERHGSRPITEPPPHWQEVYRKILCCRLDVMQTNRDIGLIEQSEYKRRWNLPAWEEMEQAALKNWLLDQMEANAIWHEYAPVSCARLRDVLARDADWVSVAEIYIGGPIDNLDELVRRLARAEATPFLPVLRYTESGLRKRGEWEQVWDLQRKEDAAEKVEIPALPKYRPNDFQKSDYWRLRGGLDVPKERFILYPTLERDADASPVLGWAGWNHLEQARALAGHYQRMRTEEGWEPERLKPILAGLLDLKPWLLQWHNEIDPEMGVRMGEYFVQFAEGQCQELGFSPEEVRAWQPTAAAGPARRGRRRRSR